MNCFLGRGRQIGERGAKIEFWEIYFARAVVEDQRRGVDAADNNVSETYKALFALGM